MAHARVTPEQAHRLMVERGYVYLDVRTEPEVALGLPAGAYNVPFELPGAQGPQENPAFVAVVRAALGPQAKIVVGCETGSRSRAAAERLLDAGFAEVVEQRAGYAGSRDAFGQRLLPGWRAAGLPCAEQPQPERAYAALCARKQEDSF
jgi:rhodanese-related sulfurtransferase